MSALTPTAIPRAAVVFAAGLLMGALLLPAGAAQARKRDRLPPRIRSATTLDSDRDGHIDAVLLSYSERIKTRGGTGRRVFKVAGYTITKTARRDKRTVMLSLAERTAFDTGARPRITYTPQRRKVKKGKRKRRNPDYRQAVFDRAGNQAFSGSFRTVVDGAVPLLVSARTEDGNGDGHIDGVVAVFSEAVRTPSGSPAGVAGRTITAIGKPAAEQLRFSIKPSPLIDTETRPRISFPGSGSRVTDLARNPLPAGQARTPADAAAPVLVGAVTSDQGGTSGKLDHVQLNFSEPVTHAADADGSYPITVAGHSIASVGAASGNAVTVTLSETSGFDTGASPAVTYAHGRSAAIVDAAHNETPSRSFNATGDGAVPVLVAGRTGDVDANGKLDHVAARFSENVSFTGGGTDFAVGGRTVTNIAAASGTDIGVTIQEAGFDTDARPSLTYSPSGTPVVDATGHPAAGATLAQSDDTAPPVIVAAKTSDANNDGRLDGIDLTYSEGVSHGVDSSAPFPLDVAGKEILSVGAASGTSLRVNLKAGGAPDTGDQPNVTYATGAGPVTDGAQNGAGDQTFTATEDKARPVMISAVTADNSPDNGQIDAVTTQWSESIDRASTANGGTFDVDAPYAVGGSALTIGATTIDIPITRPNPRPASDRGGDPLFDVTYKATGTLVKDKAAAPNDAWPDGPAEAAVQARPVCTDDTDEQDDSEAAAKTMPAAKRISMLCGADVDWRKFHASQNDAVSVSVGAGGTINTQPELRLGGSPVGTLVDRGVGLDDDLSDTCTDVAGCDYTLKIATATYSPDDVYCTNWSTSGDAKCGVQPGDLVITEVGNNGASSFVELKNASNQTLDIQGLKITDTSGTTCTIKDPSGNGPMNVAAGQYVWGDETNDGNFTCAAGGDINVAPAGEEIFFKDGSIVIDSADLRGVTPSASHSLELSRSPEDADQNDTLLDPTNPVHPANWCYTFKGDTKGEAGDGCDDYVINEVLLNANDLLGPDDGRTFIELRGNPSAVAGSRLLGSYILTRFHAVASADATLEMEHVLPTDADPGVDGFYVIADANDLTGATTVPGFDLKFADLDPANADESVQLLRAGTPDATCPGGSVADAVGLWNADGRGTFDEKRSCRTVEMTDTESFPAPGDGKSASRGPAATDSNNNSLDFVVNFSPSPGSPAIDPNPS